MTHRTEAMIPDAVITEQAQRVLAHGPTRVVINADAEAISPGRAMVTHGIVSDVIFIRNDGWSLGAPTDLISVAERTWRELWIVVVNVQTKRWRTYDINWTEVL